MLCPKIWSLAIWSLEILIALSDVELFADYESVIKKFEIACKHLQIAVFLAGQALGHYRENQWNSKIPAMKSLLDLVVASYRLLFTQCYLCTMIHCCLGDN